MKPNNIYLKNVSFLRANLQLKKGVKMSDIFGNFNLQKNEMYNFIKIEQKRVEIMKRRDEATCINVQNSLICY